MPLGGGKVSEIGGQWVGPTQDRVLALADELGLETFPTYHDGTNVLELRRQAQALQGHDPAAGAARAARHRPGPAPARPAGRDGAARGALGGARRRASSTRPRSRDWLRAERPHQAGAAAVRDRRRHGLGDEARARSRCCGRCTASTPAAASTRWWTSRAAPSRTGWSADRRRSPSGWPRSSATRWCSRRPSSAIEQDGDGVAVAPTGCAVGGAPRGGRDAAGADHADPLLAGPLGAPRPVRAVDGERRADQVHRGLRRALLARGRASAARRSATSARSRPPSTTRRRTARPG